MLFDEPKNLTFYATPADQETIQRILELRPYYKTNHAIREGLWMLLRSLEQSSPAPPQPKQRVEYNVAGEG